MEITRHFTATTIVVYKNKALLHLHKKLDIWIPVGGHIDRDELPEEAALREVKEESGLDVELYNPDQQIEMNDVEQLIRPAHILLEDINKYHQHIDFIYYARASAFEINSQENETNNLRWFTVDEIQRKDDLLENVRKLSLEAVDLLCAD